MGDAECAAKVFEDVFFPSLLCSFFLYIKFVVTQELGFGSASTLIKSGLSLACRFLGDYVLVFLCRFLFPSNYIFIPNFMSKFKKLMSCSVWIIRLTGTRSSSFSSFQKLRLFLVAKKGDAACSFSFVSKLKPFFLKLFSPTNNFIFWDSVYLSKKLVVGILNLLNKQPYLIIKVTQ